MLKTTLRIATCTLFLLALGAIASAAQMGPLTDEIPIVPPDDCNCEGTIGCKASSGADGGTVFWTPETGFKHGKCTCASDADSETGGKTCVDGARCHSNWRACVIIPDGKKLYGGGECSEVGDGKKTECYNLACSDCECTDTKDVFLCDKDKCGAGCPAAGQAQYTVLAVGCGDSDCGTKTCKDGDI